jgi:tetratricopeptide (TPR) repeat protein
LPVLLVVHLLAASNVPAQSENAQAREAEWKAHKLPSVEFVRYLHPSKVLLFRIPKSWKQTGPMHFKGPHDSDLSVMIEKVPDGVALRSLTTALIQQLRDLAGGPDALLVRPTEFSALEAREFMFSLRDPAGRMTRRLIWSTVSGPNAISFVLIEPDSKVSEVEPYFKAIIESAVVFESDAQGTIFEGLRSAAIKEERPARVDHVLALLGVVNGFDPAARNEAIGALSPIFDSNPDSVIDLLFDRRALVRASAVEALERSSNTKLDGFLLLALADPAADVAARAARALARRKEVVKLLREDSAGWSGLQVERVMRAMAMLDDKSRGQIVTELAGELGSRPKVRNLKPPPPPPPPAGSARAAPPPKKSPAPGPGGVPRGLTPIGLGFVAIRGYNDETVSLAMLPDFEALSSILPVNALLEDDDAAPITLALALESRARLPVDRLMKLLSDSDGDVARLAALSLGVSAASTDIARIDAFSQSFVEVSAGTGRPLKEELRITTKKIRWRGRFASATGALRDQIVKEALADTELADFAWSYAGDHLDAGGPRLARPLPRRAREGASSDSSKSVAGTVSQLGENLLPPAVTLYAAIPDAQGLIDKIAGSFSSIQLDSARTQANLLLMIKSIEAQLARTFDAPVNSSILESSGIKPHSPIVAASWTGAGAPRGLKAAQRKAVIARVTDRDRFEHLIATYQRKVGRFDLLPEIVSAGARFISTLPALVPLGATALTGAPTSLGRTFTTSYVLMGAENCNGYPVTVVERREIAGQTIKRDTVYIAYVGDAAVLAPDWFSLRDCLSRLERKGETLASNDDFKRAAAAGGDAIYLSDPVALLGPAREGDELALKEYGALRISKSGWESSFNIGFSERERLKFQPFNPSRLKAPGELLPRSSFAYLFANLDVGSAWRGVGRELIGAQTLKHLESVWALDFQREVLPELGPECGAVLLGLPTLAIQTFRAPWAVFVQTRSDKLSKAFSEGKLLKDSSPGAKAVRVKIGTADYWFSVKNRFLVIGGSAEAIERLDSSERLSTARDFERAAKRAPAEVIAFGGTNLEAAVSGIKPDPNDALESQAIATLVSLARAFHSQNFYIAPSEEGLSARMSVSLDREGRYSLSDLASLSKDFQFASAEVELRGVPIADQKRIDTLTLKITSKAPGAIDRIKEDIASVAQASDKRSDTELIVTLRPRRPPSARKVEIPVKSAELEPFLKPTREITSHSPEVIAQAKEIAGDDRDAWSVARKLSDWTFKNLKWKRVDYANAKDTLAAREADCLEFSELFVAMARSLGLPARIVLGMAHTDGSFGAHAWVEVWIGEWVELDPTWGMNFADATHIRSSSSELIAYSSLNLIGIEVLEASRSVPEFQREPDALANALCDEFNGEDNEALAASLDPAVLIDGLMGDGAWAGLNAAERRRIYSAHRRLVSELKEAFTDEWKIGAGARVLKVKQQADRAEALIIHQGSLASFQFTQRGSAWFLREVKYEDLAYSAIAEELRPAIVSLEASRKGLPQPEVLDSAEARVLLARANDPKQAVQLAKQLLKEQPDSQTLRYLEALCLMSAASEPSSPEIDEALRIWSELAGEQPAFAPALRELGNHYASPDEDDPDRRGKHDNAIDLLRRYAVLVPDDPRPHETLAEIYEERDETSNAEAQYRKLIEMDPFDPSNYSALAGILARQMRYKEALEAIDQSKGRGLTKETMFANLFFAADGEPESVKRVEGLAAEAAERLAKNFEANLNLASVRIENGRAADAFPLLRRAAELDAKSAEPYNLMAKAHRKLRNWAAALRSADQAIELDAKDPEGHFSRACALTQLRRRVEAMAALKKALELDEYSIYTEDFEKEPDLKPLATLPAFKKLVNERKKAAEGPAEPKKTDIK